MGAGCQMGIGRKRSTDVLTAAGVLAVLQAHHRLSVDLEALFGQRIAQLIHHAEIVAAANRRGGRLDGDLFVALRGGRPRVPRTAGLLSRGPGDFLGAGGAAARGTSRFARVRRRLAHPTIRLLTVRDFTLRPR